MKKFNKKLIFSLKSVSTQFKGRWTVSLLLQSIIHRTHCLQASTFLVESSSSENLCTFIVFGFREKSQIYLKTQLNKTRSIWMAWYHKWSFYRFIYLLIMNWSFKYLSLNLLHWRDYKMCIVTSIVHITYCTGVAVIESIPCINRSVISLWIIPVIIAIL